MNKLLADLRLWDAASESDRKSAVYQVSDQLPAGFALEHINTYSLGGQMHQIATFTHDQFRFALVPGHPEVTLGDDRAHPFEPTPVQLEDWRIFEAEYGESLDSYLDHYLTPLRTVAIAPLLVEVVSTRAEYLQDGSDQYEGYQRVINSCGESFRLPTADEWEYACAAGTRQLFRWGSETPQSSSAEVKTWDLHRLPNAFGLTMNDSTYDSELCLGPIHRGGDGGGAVHGGIGTFITWLPLASAFQVPAEEIEDWWIDDIHVRRVRRIEI